MFPPKFLMVFLIRFKASMMNPIFFLVSYDRLKQQSLSDLSNKSRLFQTVVAANEVILLLLLMFPFSPCKPLFL